jgi:AcrR family transcriptional regulator
MMERDGPRRPLSRGRILAAAIGLVDREGLAALSMRKLGQELGVEAMSLYNHVPNKAALLDGMVGAVLGELEVPPADAAPWEDRLRAVARAYRRLALAHPKLFPLLVTRPLNAPEALRPLEATLDLLRAAGFDAATTLRAFRAVSGFVEGYVLDEITGFSFAADAPGDGPRLELDRLDARAFPRLRELAPHFAAQERDAEFEFGLDALIVGLGAALTARSPTDVAANEGTTWVAVQNPGAVVRIEAEPPLRRRRAVDNRPTSPDVRLRSGRR